MIHLKHLNYTNYLKNAFIVVTNLLLLKYTAIVPTWIFTEFPT